MNTFAAERASDSYLAGSYSGRGLYLRDLTVYLENDRIWYLRNGDSQPTWF
jgi:hypothetical protein